ncbi:MAG: RNase H family protein [Acidimicrobiales bacterium]
MVTRAYTDGACLGNPGPGGWGWVVNDGPWASGFEADSTNQRMELTAAFRAVSSLPGPLEIVSDSTYVVNCFRDKWYVGWRKRGWKNAKKDPVANRDLWEPFIDLVELRGDVEFTWVKGHSGHPMNDAADALATGAAQTQEPGTGQRFGPEVIRGLPSDSAGQTRPKPGVGGGGVRAPIDGHGVLITGHRPPELGGYGATSVAAAVRKRLALMLEYEAKLRDDLVVVTGLGLGAEQLGAEAAIDAGIPFVAVLAYKAQDQVWSEPLRARFAALKAAASEVRVLEQKRPKDKAAARRALQKRDDLVARLASEAYVVWNGEEQWVARQVGSLQEYLGEDAVRTVNPDELNA